MADAFADPQPPGNRPKWTWMVLAGGVGLLAVLFFLSRPGTGGGGVAGGTAGGTPHLPLIDLSGLEERLANLLQQVSAKGNGPPNHQVATPTVGGLGGAPWTGPPRTSPDQPMPLAPANAGVGAPGDPTASLGLGGGLLGGFGNAPWTGGVRTSPEEPLPAPFSRVSV